MADQTTALTLNASTTKRRRRCPVADQWYSQCIGEVTPDGELIMYDEPIINPTPITPVDPKDFGIPWEGDVRG